MPEVIPFADSHWEQHVAWRNAEIISEPITVSYAREMDKLVDTEFKQERYALLEDGALAVTGLVTSEPADTGNPFYLRLTADADAAPEHLTTMAAHLKARAIALGGDHVQTWFREDRQSVADAWKSLGFEYKLRAPESSCDLALFDQTVNDLAGLRLEPFDFIGADEGRRREFYDAFAEMERDIPNTFENTLPSYDFMAAEWLGGRGQRTRRHVVWDGDKIVGITELIRNELKPEQAMTGLTGVRRGWRRRGIARALKITSMSAYRNAGGLKVYTVNEEENPMFQLNLALGFREEYALAAYVWEPE